MIVTVPMFRALVRSIWILVAAFTLASELVPLSLAFEEKFPTLIFYIYIATKLAGFLVFGFLTPLTWWSYRTFGVGVLFATFITAIVEIGQSLIPGHRASFIELTVKFLLLFAGFVGGLAVRKSRQLEAGPLSFRFSSPADNTRLP